MVEFCRNGHCEFQNDADFCWEFFYHQIEYYKHFNCSRHICIIFVSSQILPALLVHFNWACIGWREIILKSLKISIFAPLWKFQATCMALSSLFVWKRIVLQTFFAFFSPYHGFHFCDCSYLSNGQRIFISLDLLAPVWNLSAAWYLVQSAFPMNYYHEII